MSYWVALSYHLVSCWTNMFFSSALIKYTNSLLFSSLLTVLNFGLPAPNTHNNNLFAKRISVKRHLALMESAKLCGICLKSVICLDTVLFSSSAFLYRVNGSTMVYHSSSQLPVSALKRFTKVQLLV